MSDSECLCAVFGSAGSQSSSAAYDSMCFLHVYIHSSVVVLVPPSYMIYLVESHHVLALKDVFVVATGKVMAP